MRTVTKTLDINAHICNLKCNIVRTDDGVLAYLSFDNMSYGNITAIKFNAVGYNVFGDIVLVNGKTSFFLIIQDIMVRRNESVADLKAKMPDENIQRLVLEESQICYDDGRIEAYNGKMMKAGYVAAVHSIAN